MERDLSGRCGSCGFFIALYPSKDAKDGKENAVENAMTGECRLGCWPSPLKDTATCSSHKPIGASFEGSLRRKRAVGTPRRYREEAPVQPRLVIPKEIGMDMDQETFREVLREVLLDELGIRDVQLGDRWQGGEVELRPGREGTQSKVIPLDMFFRKIVSVRDKIRVLEQKINGHKGLSAADKVQLQQYITGCYGSLTTFNVLFKDKEDQFVGQSG